MFWRKSLIGSRCSCLSSTPAFTAAVYASSGIGSHAVKTRSFRSASGTNSLIFGTRFSVRLPSRIVAIWLSDPIGNARPRRTFSTPAMNVVETAPSPTSITPSFPVAGAISRAPPVTTAVPVCSRAINVLCGVPPRLQATSHVWESATAAERRAPRARRAPPVGSP